MAGGRVIFEFPSEWMSERFCLSAMYSYVYVRQFLWLVQTQVGISSTRIRTFKSTIYYIFTGEI